MTQKDTNELDSVTHNEMKMDAASSLLATLMTEKRCATCALMGESTTKMVSNCDAIVRAEGQMPDSSTSHV